VLFLMTAADSLQDQWSWIVRYSCGTSSTSGTAGRIFIFPPRQQNLWVASGSGSAASQAQQRCPNQAAE
jgi:hypothetical protein